MDYWISVEDFPEYSVSQLGKIRRDSSGRILETKVNQYGVVYIGMVRGFKQYQRSVALLVANAFLARDQDQFDTPIHINGDRHDNRVDNLAWRPRWFAVAYNRQFKQGYDQPITEPIVELRTGEVWPSSWDCAIANGLLERDVVLSIINRTYAFPSYQQFAMVKK